jgi:hypothetical protein
MLDQDQDLDFPCTQLMVIASIKYWVEKNSLAEQKQIFILVFILTNLNKYSF